MELLKALAFCLAGALALAFVSYWLTETFVFPTKAAMGMILILVPAALLAGFMLGVSFAVSSGSAANGWRITAALIYGVGATLGWLDASHYRSTRYVKEYSLHFELEVPPDFNAEAHTWRLTYPTDSSASKKERSNTDYLFRTFRKPRIFTSQAHLFSTPPAAMELLIFRDGRDQPYTFRPPKSLGESQAATSALPWTDWETKEAGFRLRWRVK